MRILILLGMLLAQAAPQPAPGPAPTVDPQTIDPFAFPAPTERARQFFGYASPWTLLMLAAAIVIMAALIRRFTPPKRKRIKRATILFMLYLTCFMLAAILGVVHAEGWS